MKKDIYLLCLLLFAASVLFTSCRDNDDEPYDDEPYISSSLDGVVINGVRWATRNVDAPGTFAASPASPGMFFQWNRRQGWAATGNVTDWNNSTPTGTYWTRVNDPCPTGWRVPTQQEFDSLIEATFGFTFDTDETAKYAQTHWRNGTSSRRWVQNWRNTGTNGLIFGVEPNFIFLPAAGERAESDGTLNFVGEAGSYWTGMLSTWGWEAPFSLTFSNVGMSGAIEGWTLYGMSVRCVADE